VYIIARQNTVIISDVRPWPWQLGLGLGNESLPKIVVNDAISIFFNAMSILVISNHNSLRVLFDKIASVYFFENICMF